MNSDLRVWYDFGDSHRQTPWQTKYLHGNLQHCRLKNQELEKEQDVDLCLEGVMEEGLVGAGTTQKEWFLLKPQGFRVSSGC